MRRVNFLGHATVALWHRSEPAFVLGSMLPDFASMVRTRIRAVHHRDVADGVELHHRTDSVFHVTPTFVGLCSEVGDTLMDRGLQRGPARAVAHVGTELLLDGWLLEDGTLRRAYVGALRALFERALDRPIEWRARDGRTRLRELCERLLRWGVPEGYREPSFVADRLALVLSRRPLLALDEPSRRVVAEELPEVQRRVVARAPRLMQELRDGLEEADSPRRNLTPAAGGFG